MKQKGQTKILERNEKGRFVKGANIGHPPYGGHSTRFKKGHKPLTSGKNLIGLQTGESHWNWKGGVTPINEKIRKSMEYRLWRTAVFERDNYTCVWCGEKGIYLHADHIKPFAYFPELRFAIDNGRTLCKECHQTTETYGAKVKYEKNKIK